MDRWSTDSNSLVIVASVRILWSAGGGLMVNLMPREPQPQDEGYRLWLLARLDLMSSLVESGADCALEDSQFTAHNGRRVAETSLSFYEDVWVARHRSRRRR